MPIFWIIDQMVRERKCLEKKSIENYEELSKFIENVIHENYLLRVIKL